ncbi:MAG TPA: hypothetical protein VM120_02150 [Bryobacteraceae bacterium]|nr:hypothetical protein [Bryobacteraceae bacterium]
MKTLLCLIALASSLTAADAALIEKGRAEEKRACVGCHGLKIIHIQRLTRAQWDAELTKMAGWGTVIKDREALMEYLTASYGADKPAAPLTRSENGAAKK